jgi:hypothetical protein
MNSIKSNHPARNQVCGIETYWDKPGAAVSHLADLLASHGITIVDTISFDDTQEDYRATYRLQNESELGNVLVFSWHRMPSGRFEITAYLS